MPSSSLSSPLPLTSDYEPLSSTSALCMIILSFTLWTVFATILQGRRWPGTSADQAQQDQASSDQSLQATRHNKRKLFNPMLTEAKPQTAERWEQTDAHRPAAEHNVDSHIPIDSQCTCRLAQRRSWSTAQTNYLYVHLLKFRQFVPKEGLFHSYPWEGAQRMDPAIPVPAKHNCYLSVTRFGTNAWNRNKIRQKVTRAHHYYLTFEIKELIK